MCMEDPVSHIWSHMCKDGNHNWRDSPLVMTILCCGISDCCYGN